MNHNSASTKDIDEVDDDLFISRKPQNYIFAEKKVQDINERTNRMMTNSRKIVEETQQIGQSTLENLSVQREALERVENDLDSINTMTRATQKHLNNMRSFFGGIKSLFGSKDNSTTAGIPTVPSTTNASMPRSKTLANVPSNIPAGGGSSSFQQGGSSNISSRASFAAASAVDRAQATAASVPHLETEDKDEFEANLSEIGFGLGRLKEMAMKLGDEIGDQNEMLDRITDKSERAGDSVKHQNRQIQQLLKKG
uniref:Soluable nsf attachment protein 29 n=1 Tax=Aceria tosichella TaxID=561515 RepID=A0A6G1SGM9_9ACAR